MTKVLIVGPYTTNYSLAKVNRGLAQALAKQEELEVKIWQSPEFEIDANFTNANEAKRLGFAELLTNEIEDVDVTIFNHYPTYEAGLYGLRDLPGKTKLMYLAWEETVFPEQKVAEINQYAHGVLAATSYTRDVLRVNKVRIPIHLLEEQGLSIFLQQVKEASKLKHSSLAIISPYNTYSGIAEYTSLLHDKHAASFKQTTYLANRDVSELIAEEPANVRRLWETGNNNLDELKQWLTTEKPEHIHIQFHQGELNPQTLFNLTDTIKQELPKTKFYLTPHVIRAHGFDLSSYQHELRKFTKIFVHNQADLDYLASRSLENLELFRHPLDTPMQIDQVSLREKLDIGPAIGPIIASHGIASHHKGLLETAEAIKDLQQTYPNILWLALNAVNFDNSSSSETYEQLQSKVKEIGIEANVRLFPDYLDKSAIKTLLAAADIGLLTYQDVGEAASGAISKYFSVGLPTIVTDISTFKEFNTEVYKIDEVSPEKISQAITDLYTSSEQRQNLSKSAKQRAEAYSWEVSSVELLTTYAAE